MAGAREPPPGHREQARAGTLHLVSTPIGNLEDLTRRAERTLREVDFIVAEDTRRTRKLLTHLDIKHKKLVKLDAHADARSIARVLDQLSSGRSCACVTDAGTPGISDPGATLVRAADDKGIVVSCVPGPSAVTAAVSVSGLIEGPFVFLGFLPRKGPKRALALQSIKNSPWPVVLFEAPTRVAATLSELAALVGERHAVLCRELTKLHEERQAGALRDLSAETFRGEITLVIAGSPVRDAELRPEQINKQIERALRRGDKVRMIVSALRKKTSLSSQQLYRQVQSFKDKAAGPSR